MWRDWRHVDQDCKAGTTPTQGDTDGANKGVTKQQEKKKARAWLLTVVMMTARQHVFYTIPVQRVCLSKEGKWKDHDWSRREAGFQSRRRIGSF